MDVKVLAIVCHPGEKPKNGPNIAQTMMSEAATKNTSELPANFAILVAKSANFFSILSNVQFPSDRELLLHLQSIEFLSPLLDNSHLLGWILIQQMIRLFRFSFEPCFNMFFAG